MDLSSLFNPMAAQQPDVQPQVAPTQVTDQQPPQAADGWNSFLSNPATRAALLNFGLNMMTGGWGSPTQRIGQSIGQGVEAGAQVGANQETEADKNAAIARQTTRQGQEDALEREKMANQRNIAQVGADTRISTANIRASGGPKSNNELALYNKTYNSTAATIRQSIQYQTGQIGEDAVQQQAAQAADNALITGRAAVGIAPGPNLANPAVLQAPPGGVMPPGPAGGNSVSQPQSPQVPAASSPPRMRNPKTGQIVEWNGTAWAPVPVQPTQGQ